MNHGKAIAVRVQNTGDEVKNSTSSKTRGWTRKKGIQGIQETEGPTQGRDWGSFQPRKGKSGAGIWAVRRGRTCPWAAATGERGFGKAFCQDEISRMPNLFGCIRSFREANVRMNKGKRQNTKLNKEQGPMPRNTNCGDKGKLSQRTMQLSFRFSRSKGTNSQHGPPVLSCWKPFKSTQLPFLIY